MKLGLLCAEIFYQLIEECDSAAAVSYVAKLTASIMYKEIPVSYFYTGNLKLWSCFGALWRVQNQNRGSDVTSIISSYKGWQSLYAYW